MAEPSVLLARSIDDSKINPDKFGVPLVCGEIAYASWVSASNPTAEVLDQATAQLVTVQSQNVTIDLSAGTIVVPRDGIYLLKLVLAKVSSASASGVMDFTIQKNTAALTPSITCGLLQPAVVNNSMSASCEGRVALTKGDSIRVVVTGTVGGIITVTAGRFIVEMLADATVATQV